MSSSRALLIVLGLTFQSLLTAAMPLNETSPDFVPYLIENCNWEFSSTICGSGISSQQVTYLTGGGCEPVTTGMKSVWTNSCSSVFKACTMWIQPDCTGDYSLRISDPSNTNLGVCFSEYYYINAISCEQ